MIKYHKNDEAKQIIMGETNPSTAHWTMKASFPPTLPKLVDSKYVKLLTVYIFAYW